MKKTFTLLLCKSFLVMLLLIVGFVTNAFAQPKIMLRPSLGVWDFAKGTNDEDREPNFSANMTVGFYIDPKYRIDVTVNYGKLDIMLVPNPNYTSVVRTSMMFTPIFSVSRLLLTEASLGVGYQYSDYDDVSGIVVPLKLALGVNLSPKFAIGVEAQHDFGSNRNSTQHVAMFASFKF